MGYQVEKTADGLEQDLSVALKSATSIITKEYLDKLKDYELVVPSEEDIDIDIAECGQFYKLSKLVFNTEENFLDKLTTIVNVAFSIEGSIATIIKSDGNSIQYYIGIVSKNFRMNTGIDKKRRDAASKAFKGAILGNLIGSDITTLTADEVIELQQHIFSNPEQAVSAVSGIVSLRSQDDKHIQSYVQGIENLTDSLKGQKYTILLLADPISTNEIQLIKQGYEMLYTQLATFLRSTVTLNQSDTLTLSKTQTEGVTHGIATGIALTQSKSNSKSRFKSINANVGLNLGLGPVLGLGLGVGLGVGTNTGESSSSGKTNTTTQSSSQNRSYSNATAVGVSEGKSLQLNYENRTVKALLDKIDKHLERLDRCESFGAFECAAYVLADNREDALTIASNYNALMRGEASSVQASRINTWHRPEETKLLHQYLNSFVHPRFHTQDMDNIIVTPASVLSGREIAIQIGLPKKSINGISVVQTAPFGRNMLVNKQAENITLGKLYHMGQIEQEQVKLDINSLSSHTFISGSTGTGKSNTIYHMLDSLGEKGIRFMVIEPAKGEYKHLFGNRSDVRVYGTNDQVTPLLKINPFAFPEGIHVLEHIDRLIEIFNVCWPMYAAMPAVLKEATEVAYIECGWNLDTSKNSYEEVFFPTFADIIEALNKVISNSAYSEELKSNYKGSLLTRVKSLTNGLNGRIFCEGEIDSKVLFDENVIIDISRVGSMETKAMIMGVLVMRLQEHRMTQGGFNKDLKHVTVLEEAHNLLKRTSTEQSPEGSNLLGKSVEMLANAIAEMRTYGEGFIIADQSPGLLDMSVIRNTNTKIILRIPEFSDRELVGRASAMNEDQIIELAKLQVGVAAVYQNNWLEPVLCKIDKFKNNESPYDYQYPSHIAIKESVKFKSELIKFLLKGRISEEIEVDVAWLDETLAQSKLLTKDKIAVKYWLEEYLHKQTLTIWQNQCFGQLSNIICDLLECRNMLDNIYLMVKDLEELNHNLSQIVQKELVNTTPGIILEVCHCIMKEMSKQSDENLKIYYQWHNMMTKKMI